jgi:hypothetical protein
MADNLNTRISMEEVARTAATSALAERTSILEASVGAPAAAVPVSAKPEIADKPSFLKDVRNGLIHVAKTIWQVPAAQGYIATLIVRLGLPAGLAAILVPLVDALVK